MGQNYFKNDVQFKNKLKEFFDNNNRKTGRTTLIAEILAELIVDSDANHNKPQPIWVQDHHPLLNLKSYRKMCEKIEYFLKEYVYNGIHLELIKDKFQGFYRLNHKSLNSDNPKLIINDSVVYQPKKEHKENYKEDYIKLICKYEIENRITPNYVSNHIQLDLLIEKYNLNIDVDEFAEYFLVALVQKIPFNKICFISYIYPNFSFWFKEKGRCNFNKFEKLDWKRKKDI